MTSPSSSVARFLRFQAIYIGVGAIGTAVFWAIGQNINPATVLVYSLCIGNLATPLMNRVRSTYSQRPFPYNWLLFLAVLTLLTPVIYIISSIVVWLIAPPSPQSLSISSKRAGNSRASLLSLSPSFPRCSGKTRSTLRYATPNSSVLLISPPPNWNAKTRTCSAHGKFRSHCFPKKFLSFLASKSLHPGAPLAWSAAITSTCFVSLTTASPFASPMWWEKCLRRLAHGQCSGHGPRFACDSESPALDVYPAQRCPVREHCRR